MNYNCGRGRFDLRLQRCGGEVPGAERLCGKIIVRVVGQFLFQIQNGAPYDLFFSADIGYAKKLEAAGLTEPGTLYEYAVGKIVLWVPSASKLDLSKGLAVLTDPAIHRIAIANPEHAPYGRAAKAAMQKEGVYDQVKDKIVLGENMPDSAVRAVRQC